MSSGILRDVQNNYTLYFQDWIEKNHYTIKQWWDPDEFNWGKNSWLIANHCMKSFNLWWDKDKFNHLHSAWLTGEIGVKHFNEWWDKGKYNYNHGTNGLIMYCSDHFDKWWDNSVYKSNTYGNAIHMLSTYCPSHFDTWWDPTKCKVESGSRTYLLYKEDDEIISTWGIKKYNMCTSKYIKTLPKEKQLECTLKWIK